MNTCILCKQTKDKSEFWIDRKNKNGLYSYCKSCHFNKIGSYKDHYLFF